METKQNIPSKVCKTPSCILRVYLAVQLSGLQICHNKVELY